LTLREVLGVDGRMLLAWMVGRWGGRVWAGIIWLRIGTSGRLL